MAERTSYESGTFSWIDLATTDQDGAKAFYAGLFGWECEDTPVGGGATYTMCRLDGKDVGAITTQAEQEPCALRR
jgi:predicted enzyme related to lactoylglutathione lyase